jgi:predicted oxidoreductase
MERRKYNIVNGAFVLAVIIFATWIWQKASTIKYSHNHAMLDYSYSALLDFYLRDNSWPSSLAQIDFANEEIRSWLDKGLMNIYFFGAKNDRHPLIVLGAKNDDNCIIRTPGGFELLTQIEVQEKVRLLDAQIIKR